MQNATQRLAEVRGVGFGEDERRPQLDYVVMRAIRTSEDSFFAQAIYDIRRLIGRRFSCVAGLHEVPPQEKSRSADISYHRMPLLQISALTYQQLTNPKSVCLQAFLL